MTNVEYVILSQRIMTLKMFSWELQNHLKVYYSQHKHTVEHFNIVKFQNDILNKSYYLYQSYSMNQLSFEIVYKLFENFFSVSYITLIFI